MKIGLEIIDWISLETPHIFSWDSQQWKPVISCSGIPIDYQIFALVLLLAIDTVEIKQS